MKKIWLIIQREYITRVRNKTFLLSTFLTPLLFAGVFAIIIFITVKGQTTDRVAFRDNTGIFQEQEYKRTGVVFISDPEADTSNYLSKGYSAIVYAPNFGINNTDKWQVYSKKNFGLIQSEAIRDIIRNEYERYVFREQGIDVSLLDSVKKASGSLSVETAIIGQGEEIKKGNSGIAYGVGYAASFLIYITLFIYGSMVMRGVMEEKTNRIAEVVVSSVKPFQLMMGKILGIGAVGLTQFVLWIMLMFLLSTGVGFLIPSDVDPETLNSAMAQANESTRMAAISGIKDAVGAVNVPLLVVCFLFYFLFGYLFYAALFAAVGSAVNEDPQDAQSLMFPITMPIVLAIVIMINAITNPESPMAVWSSIIPFFSPIVMMARLPFGVPGTVAYWELALSMVMLVVGFLVTTWLSAKIYRTGILMYGKKPTWKELLKWAFRK
jgi:ABC-2 type transport system permease protein